MAGISLSSGFLLSVQSSLDLRLVKEDINDLNSMPTIQKYIGMMVYIKSEKAYYYLKDNINTWAKITLDDLANMGLKADKLPTVYEDNVLIMSADGGLKDSGHKLSEYGMIDDTQYVADKVLSSQQAKKEAIKYSLVFG
jgi:hypothetical protein